MIRRSFLILLALAICTVSASLGQTQKPLTNADIINMTKQGFDPGLIVKDIQSSSTEFDTSPQELINLKNAGVDKSVMEAMLSSQAKKPTGTVEDLHGTTTVTAGVVLDQSKPNCSVKTGCLLKEGTQVPLKFATDLSSKTANEGEPVEFLLDDDLKVGETVVVSKGAHAVATVSNAKKAGMMGKPGELSIQIQYLVSGSYHVRIRGTKTGEADGLTCQRPITGVSALRTKAVRGTARQGQRLR